MDKKTASAIVILWADLVKSGSRNIDGVPTKLRDKVKAYLGIA